MHNIITFDTLVDNTYSGVTVTFTDSAGNSSTLTLSTFVIDNVLPELNITTPISTRTNDNTPSVTINSTKDATISSSLSFSSPTNGLVGDNTITFNTLVDATYNKVTVTFTDFAGNPSTITLPIFIIDTVAPTLTETTLISTPTNINTPQVVITSNKVATISSSLPFTSTTSGIIGANTITFNALSDNTYNGETVTFTDLQEIQQQLYYLHL